MALRSLNPLQYPSKDHQHHTVQRCQPTDDLLLDLRFPIIAIHGDQEEGNVHGNKDSQSTPPRIHPHKGRRLRQKDFNDREKGRVEDSEPSIKPFSLNNNVSGK
jgi:hypothetical protein